MRLIDNFMPLIGYLVLLRQNVAATQPAYQQVRGDVQRLLSQSEACVKKGLSPPDDYDQARFIVCAWADELLLGSDWKEKGLWQREQLQRLYYNTTDAGVEAFERLNQLGYQQKEVREVFYVCLSLGFRGRFINPGDDFLLDQLRSSNLKLLTGSSAAVAPPGQDLFPEAFPLRGIEAAAPARRFSLPLLAALAGPVLLFGVLHLIYRFTLSSVADRLF